MIKTYDLDVPADDFIRNFDETRKALKYLLKKILKRGSAKVGITIETIMFKDPDIRQAAAFRSKMTPIGFADDVPDIVASKINKITQTIELYNQNGMSGSVVEKVTSVKARVLRYQF